MRTVALERKILTSPAWDRGRDGVSSVTMHFVLTGVEGAFVLSVMTGWNLDLKRSGTAQVSSVTFHDAVGSNPSRPECPFTDGPCTELALEWNGRDVFELLVSQGDDAFWERMTELYRNAAADAAGERRLVI